MSDLTPTGRTCTSCGQPIAAGWKCRPCAAGSYTSPYADGLPGHSKARRDTEMKAAESTRKRAGADLNRARALLRGAGRDGLTDAEGRESFYSFPKRRCDLLKLGEVEDSDQRRRTPRGAWAIVWRLKSESGT